MKLSLTHCVCRISCSLAFGAGCHWLGAVHLWLVHSGRMLTSGLNSLSVTVPLPCVYLMTLFSGWRAVRARLPGDDVLARHDTTQPWDREEETGHARSICLPHRWREGCFGHITSKILTLHENRAVFVTFKSCKSLTAVFAFSLSVPRCRPRPHTGLCHRCQPKVCERLLSV